MSLSSKSVFLAFIVSFCLLVNDVFTQDAHFSQFYSTPVVTNPAFTGAVNGDFRVSGVYRSQWFTVLNKPDQSFNTFAFNFDTRFDFQNKIIAKDFVGVGVYFYHNEAGINEFTTNTIALSGAYHKALDWDSRKFLTVGLQVGVLQNNVNVGNFNFADEFDGIDQFSIPTNETLPTNDYTVFDLNLGLLYTNQFSKRGSYYLSGNINHINRPNLTFYIDAIEVQMNRKYGLQFGGEFAQGRTNAWLPRLTYSKQGQHQELVLGTNYKVQMMGYADSKFYLGLWGRVVTDRYDTLHSDAVIGFVGMEYNGFQFGFSYDMALEDYFDTVDNRGTFEVTLGYISGQEAKGVICPTF